MKFLMAAFGITLATSLVIYSALRLVAGLDGEAVAAVAGFPFLASGHIYEALERQAAKQELQSTPTEALLNFPDFGLAWYKFLILAILLFMASIQAFSAYTALVMGVMGIRFELPAVGLLGFPVNAALAFFIGRWLGSRCRNVLPAMGLLTLAVAICLFADRLLTLRMGATDPDLNASDLFGTLGSLEFCELLGGGVAMYGIIGCIGLWTGSRLRAATYTSYLMRIMPRSSQQALISLAYGEAETTLRKKSHQGAAVGGELASDH
jgi:hypothetical protein